MAALSDLYNNLKDLNSNAPVIQVMSSYLTSRPSPSCTASTPVLHLSSEINEMDPVLIPSAEEFVQAECLPPTMTDRVGTIDAADSAQIVTTSMLRVDKDYINSVEELTRGQSDNPHWKSYRKHACTASNISSVCTRVDSVVKGRVNDGGSVLKSI